MKQSQLTVIIPTFNEEKWIRQAIECANFADEILVIDSFSTDTTVSIAENLGCRVIQRKFDDFSNQKNYAMQQASFDWIFILDADEYILPRLQQEIRSCIKNTPHKAFYIPRLNFYMNRFLRHGSNGRDALLRLVHKKYCHYEGLVHEKMIVEGSISTVRQILYHYTYSNLASVLQKKMAYSSLQSAQLQQKNKKGKWHYLLIKPGFRFFSEFLLRKGFLDGIAGLTSSRMNGYGVLSRYVRILIAEDKIQHKKLQNYDDFCLQLFKEARQNASQNPKKRNVFFTFWLLPKLNFLNHYFFKLNFLKGKEGYILSYLYSFKCYQSLVFQWLQNRGLE